ncbi:MAG TPA: class I SAM-dependent methyltransferase [Blastocatellia bacterium]|nr:class I SAM-dependent methyltransferase [Blastocatellia bacterium]
MRRLHFIELHEQAWVPRSLRESFVESLSVVLNLTGVYRGVPRLYAQWLRISGGREVLDLASGAGGPTATLLTALQRMGVEAPTFYLSDLFPAREKFNQMSRAYPKHILFVDEPVDALCVSPPHGQDLRQIISAFHHFRPDQAQSILENAARHSRGICILEPFQRNLLHLLLALLTIFPAMIAPFFAQKWKLRLFLTSVIVPIIPLMLVFDAAVSVMRTYTKEEVNRMVTSLGESNFRWVVGSTSFMLVFRTTYIFGWREAAAAN